MHACVCTQTHTDRHTHTPFLGRNFNLYISSTAGIRKANVFPLPVLAAPIKSLKIVNTYITIIEYF